MDRINSIRMPDKGAKEKAEKHWNSIAKPLHSLGILEDYIVKIAGIKGNENVYLNKRCAIVMCADNGVVCEGVTQSDSSVTKAVAEAMAKGDGNINNLAEVYGADVIPVDIGMASETDSKGIVNKHISDGTENIVKGPAMSIEQAEMALVAGMDMVKNCLDKGYDIIVTGEMGIGNTTTSSALASVILNEPVENVTGRGAGLNNEGYERKIDAIHRAIEVNKPDRNKPVEMLAKIGGYDIAGMAGIFLGGAVYHVPVIMDGFISAVSACIACMIKPEVKEYILCSHVSKEPAASKLLKCMGMEPVITAGMCLGEGTGGIMLLPLLDGALKMYHSIHSFEKLTIEQYEDYNKK